MPVDVYLDSRRCAYDLFAAKLEEAQEWRGLQHPGSLPKGYGYHTVPVVPPTYMLGTPPTCVFI